MGCSAGAADGAIAGPACARRRGATFAIRGIGAPCNIIANSDPSLAPSKITSYPRSLVIQWSGRRPQHWRQHGRRATLYLTDDVEAEALV